VTDASRAVEHLLYRYAEAIDGGDFSAVGELFRHGRICAASDDGPITLAEGSDAVAELYRSLVIVYDDGTPGTKHLVTNAIIDVDEEAGAATSRSSYTVLQATDGLPLQAIISGRYRDTFHRIGGTWWFASRTMVVDLTGDLSRHLRS
jgi:3-phenylpropionate/cinnamic acid dioxygenase small subunit